MDNSMPSNDNTSNDNSTKHVTAPTKKTQKSRNNENKIKKCNIKCTKSRCKQLVKQEEPVVIENFPLSLVFQEKDSITIYVGDIGIPVPISKPECSDTINTTDHGIVLDQEETTSTPIGNINCDNKVDETSQKFQVELATKLAKPDQNLPGTQNNLVPDQTFTGQDQIHPQPDQNLTISDKAFSETDLGTLGPDHVLVEQDQVVAEPHQVTTQEEQNIPATDNAIPVVDENLPVPDQTNPSVVPLPENGGNVEPNHDDRGKCSEHNADDNPVVESNSLPTPDNEDSLTTLENKDDQSSPEFDAIPDRNYPIMYPIQPLPYGFPAGLPTGVPTGYGFYPPMGAHMMPMYPGPPLLPFPGIPYPGHQGFSPFGGFQHRYPGHVFQQPTIYNHEGLVNPASHVDQDEPPDTEGKPCQEDDAMNQPDAESTTSDSKTIELSGQVEEVNHQMEDNKKKASEEDGNHSEKEPKDAAKKEENRSQENHAMDNSCVKSCDKDENSSNSALSLTTATNYEEKQEKPLCSSKLPDASLLPVTTKRTEPSSLPGTTQRMEPLTVTSKRTEPSPLPVTTQSTEPLPVTTQSTEPLPLTVTNKRTEPTPLPVTTQSTEPLPLPGTTQSTKPSPLPGTTHSSDQELISSVDSKLVEGNVKDSHLNNTKEFPKRSSGRSRDRQSPARKRNSSSSKDTNTSSPVLSSKPSSAQNSPKSDDDAKISRKARDAKGFKHTKAGNHRRNEGSEQTLSKKHPQNGHLKDERPVVKVGDSEKPHQSKKSESQNGTHDPPQGHPKPNSIPMKSSDVNKTIEHLQHEKHGVPVAKDGSKDPMITEKKEEISESKDKEKESKVSLLQTQGEKSTKQSSEAARKLKWPLSAWSGGTIKAPPKPQRDKMARKRFREHQPKSVTNGNTPDESPKGSPRVSPKFTTSQDSTTASKDKNSQESHQVLVKPNGAVKQNNDKIKTVENNKPVNYRDILVGSGQPNKTLENTTKISSKAYEKEHKKVNLMQSNNNNRESNMALKDKKINSDRNMTKDEKRSMKTHR